MCVCAAACSALQLRGGTANSTDKKKESKIVISLENLNAWLSAWEGKTLKSSNITRPYLQVQPAESDGEQGKEASVCVCVCSCVMCKTNEHCNAGYWQDTGSLLPSFSYVLTLLPLLLFLHLLSLHWSYIMVNSSAFVISHQPHTSPCPLHKRQKSKGGKRSEKT